MAARCWLRFLLDHGVEVHAVDVPDAAGRSGHDLRFAAIAHRLATPSPHDVNLLSMNPVTLARTSAARPVALQLEGRLNVMLPFWELPRLPRHWLPLLGPVDRVVAPTRFIAEAFRAAPAGPAVEYVPLPLDLDPGWTRSRRPWQVPADAVLFVSSFELFSEVERKNPWAALEAFLRAFPDDPHPRLIVKLNNPDLSPGFAATVARLRAYAARDPRIRILHAALPYRDVLSLYAAADAYVSLHRAEGLGLGMLESMALGTPVIATGWSGNLDYMDEHNAFLVGHRLVPVRGTSRPAYRPGRLDEDACWAEPDVDEAAAWMRRIAHDPSFGRKRGERAAEDVARRAVGIRIERLAAVLRRS